MTAKGLYNLINEGNIEPVFQKFDIWRWGTVLDEVYEIDGKFWEIYYRVSKDCETHELRDGDCGDPWEVWPKEVKTIIYTTEKPNE